MVVLRTEIILRNYISEKSPIAIVTHLNQDLGVGAIACVNNVKNPVLLARWFFAQLDYFCQFNFCGDFFATAVSYWQGRSWLFAPK